MGVNHLFVFSLIAVSGDSPHMSRVVNELSLDAVDLDSFVPWIIVLLQIASKAPDN
jgi:hypothetical protein